MNDYKNWIEEGIKSGEIDISNGYPEDVLPTKLDEKLKLKSGLYWIKLLSEDEFEICSYREEEGWIYLIGNECMFLPEDVEYIYPVMVRKPSILEDSGEDQDNAELPDMKNGSKNEPD